jgi:ribosomal protein S18 acetylase RimI-like enzyme
MFGLRQFKIHNPKFKIFSSLIFFEMITIIDYKSEHQPAFKGLNKGWLDKYNLTESHDLMVLDDPKGTILDRGGYIWLAEVNEMIIGSAALVKEEGGIYEIAKMAVDAAYHGKGIGKLLMEKCITTAKEIGASKLILFSNHQLVTAIGMYEKYGFKHVAVHDSPFETADIRMELDL